MIPTEPPHRDPWYIRYARSHPVSFVVTGDDDGTPYLYRWHLIPKNRFFNIYLHHFIGNDGRVMHDHPWVSLAYQLSGHLMEYFDIRSNVNIPANVSIRKISKGKWTYRKSTFIHSLIISSCDLEPVWTLFITGPKIRDWGFQTKTGWENHLDFLNLRKGEQKDA